MGLFGYRDIRTEEQRREHATKMLHEKLVANAKREEDCTPYEKELRRDPFTTTDQEIFFKTQMLMEKADFDCYVTFDWDGKPWELKVNAGLINWQCGGNRMIIKTDDQYRNRKFRLALDDKYDSINRRKYAEKLSDEDCGTLIESECVITSAMINRIYDRHHNLLFDRETFYNETDKKVSDWLDAESTVNGAIVQVEQSEITVIESGRILFDLCQFPTGAIRGNKDDIPDAIRTAIANDIAQGKCYIEEVPGRKYYCDSMKHPDGWTKQKLTGSVIGKDFDGKEKRFYYTFSATAQYGVATKANQNYHDYTEIKFSALPESFKRKTVIDAYEGAIGAYFDIFQEMTTEQIMNDFADTLCKRRVSCRTPRQEDRYAKEKKEEKIEEKKKKTKRRSL